MLNSARAARKQRQKQRGVLMAKVKANSNNIHAEFWSGAPRMSDKLRAGDLTESGITQSKVNFSWGLAAQESEARLSAGVAARESEARLGGGRAQGKTNARMPYYSAYNTEDITEADAKRAMLSRNGEHAKTVQKVLQMGAAQAQDPLPPTVHDRIPVIGNRRTRKCSDDGAAPNEWDPAQRPASARGKLSPHCQDEAGQDSARLQSRTPVAHPPQDGDWAPASRPSPRAPDLSEAAPTLPAPPAHPPQDGGWAPASQPSRRAPDLPEAAPSLPAPPARLAQDRGWSPASRPSRRAPDLPEAAPSLPASPPQSPSASPDGQRSPVHPAARPEPASAAIAAMLRKPSRKAAPPNIAALTPVPSAPSGSHGTPEAPAPNIVTLLKKRALLPAVPGTARVSPEYPLPPKVSGPPPTVPGTASVSLEPLRPKVSFPLPAVPGTASVSLEEPLPPTVSRWRQAKELTEVQDGKASIADVTQVAQLKRKASRVSDARAKASAAARARLDAAKATAAEAGEYWRLLRRGHFKTLFLKITGKFRRYVGRLWHTARGEHTLVSFMWPADVDNALYDTQAVQIFWNVIVLESVLLAMLFSNLPSDVKPGIITLIIQAVISVGPCVVCAIVLRLLFRIGNKGFRRRAKRERANVKAKDFETSNVDAYAKWKKEKFTRKRTSSERFAYAKFVTAWTLVFLTFVACILILMIYAMTFGEQKMQSFLLSIVLSLFSDFFIIEPLEILLVVSLPFLLDNSCITSVRNGAKDLGIL